MKEEGAISVDEAKQLICELCANFYGQGWVSGTGGGISMQAAGGTIVMAPSGVQKERMEPRDMFVLDAAGNVLHTPEARPPPYKPPKLSECAPAPPAPVATGATPHASSAPILLPSSPHLCCCTRALTLPPQTHPRRDSTQAYELRGAGAVLHSHSLNAVLATMLDPKATEFKVTHLEMIKVWLRAQRPRSGARLAATALAHTARTRTHARARPPPPRPHTPLPAYTRAPRAGHREPRLLRQLRGAHHRKHGARVRAHGPHAAGDRRLPAGQRGAGAPPR
jgi:methylthioribulose 1-phosphate dehydratase/enolase-phosphatase E1